ncbi:5-formyltetrahydrofolate cyclo-ligase [Aneurinibacillus thermoaerophilus]|uniref:5-formyltetrahydrofolate cyclo-ligase n=1 Tax=Aneurinibacillus thermoaerophilus TaxID=143495 RepID=UPI002E1FEFB9|nr:5-formyltetrahydrofolate cyclo-ligase [Aneurinibacillus thermoaerophilus]MED0738612.1 5-formyltetrahydrofolate cyclo-ligase [Aneurinibacillus thermoaerophilus]
MNKEEKKDIKRLVRREMLKRRAALSAEEHICKSEAVVKRLFAVPEVRAAQRLFTFLPFRDEVRIDAFLEACRDEAKNIYIPKTIVADKQMLPYLFVGWDSLVEGPYGIREPDTDRSELWSGEAFDIIIVPGVAFTERGERLGYGGGFYDRFFAQLKGPPPLLIAPCFEVQITTFLPVESHDKKVDIIVTECRTIVCS